MTLNPMIAAMQRLSGREILITAETTDEFVGNITQFATTTREQGVQHEVTSREALCSVYGIDDPREDTQRKPFVYQDGIAVIPVHGALINRFNSSWGFVTGYNFIRRQMNLALEDDDVDQIIFDINSPGGEASGCFELAREILASRRVKPSLAMVDALMASGGMAIGGAATRVYGIPSARIGSIGVYRQHMSVEDALKNEGVKITYAQAGEHKTDGTPYKDLPDSVLKDWTQDVNRTWDDFIDLVADCRDISPDEVRATQARIYRADEALALGLINAVKTTAEAVPAFVAEMAGDSPNDDEEEAAMNTKTTEATSAAVDYDKIGAMIGTAVATAITAQNRKTNIAAHGKAKGQVALASKLAANDAISEADAISMIDDAAASAPKGKQPKPNTKVAAVEEDEDEDGDDEDEGEGDDGDDDGDDAEDEAEQARAARRGNKVGGRKTRDEVNHLANAMGTQARGKIGGGNGDDEANAPKGDAAITATLLGDYAAHTGTDLRKKTA